MFRRVGRFAASHAVFVCACWIALAVGLTAVAPSWNRQAHDDDIRFLPARCPSVVGYRTLERAFPQDLFASRAILAIERGEGPLTPDDFGVVDAIAAAVERLRTDEPALKIAAVASHRHALLGRRLISDDRRCTLIQVSLATPYLAVQTRTSVDRCEAAARAVLQSSTADGLNLRITGPAGIGRDLVRASTESLDHTTWATIGLIVVVLLIVYRSVLLALIPLVTIGIAAWVAIQVLALATRLPGVTLVNVSQVFAVVILFGAGTDYCLFLIGRYREELEAGGSGRDAIEKSVRAVGGPLCASAGTVIFGLMMMGFAEFAKIRCAGPVIGVALVIGVAASLTLTPALLSLCGNRVRAPAPQPDRRPLWDQLSRWVAVRPGWIFAGALAVLVPLAAVGLRVTPSFSAIGDLSPAAESVRGLETIRRHFPPGELGPITVFLGADTNWATPAGREVVDHLSRGFARLDNVAEVRSLTQPLGEPSAHEKLCFVEQAKQVAAAGHYAATCADQLHPHFVTRLDVVLRTDPFAPESRATLGLIESWLSDHLPEKAQAMGGLETSCYGVTVNARDLAAAVGHDRARVNALVLAGVFLILLVVVRPFLVPAFRLLVERDDDQEPATLRFPLRSDDRRRAAA